MFLWGMMGVGKSTLAKKLSHALEWDVIDLDRFIELEQDASVSELFERDGEGAFRILERNALNKVVDQEEVIISVGGGTPCFLDNDQLMKSSGLCVWLDAPLPMLVNRLMNAKEERPLIKGLDEAQILVTLESLYENRSLHYGKAHLIVSINKMSIQESTKLLMSIIRDKS